MTNFMYLFCLIVWGLNFIAVKIQGTPVSLELSLTYRLVITALLFLILAWLMKPQGKPQKQDVPFIIVFGVCNFAFSYLCLYYATMLSSAAIVTLIFFIKSDINAHCFTNFFERTFAPPCTSWWYFRRHRSGCINLPNFT